MNTEAINIETLNNENDKNISVKVPNFIKSQIDEDCKNFNIPIAKYIRLILFYSLSNKDDLLKYIAKQRVNLFKNTIKDSKKITFNGTEIYFDRFDVITEDLNIIINFYAKDNSLIMSRKIPIMDVDLKFEY
jgi:hypothetical protein